jgi:hypothetical protein
MPGLLGWGSRVQAIASVQATKPGPVDREAEAARAAAAAAAAAAANTAVSVFAL